MTESTQFIIGALGNILKVPENVLTNKEIDLLKQIQSRLLSNTVKDINNNLEAIHLAESDNLDSFKHIDFKICKQKNGPVLFENEVFRIEFDIPTPRAHLIILFKTATFRKSHKSVRDLTEPEVKSLIDLVDDFMTMINGQSETYTLSFHTGAWASAHHFHGHISIDVGLYLRLLEEKNLDVQDFAVSKNWNQKLKNTGIKDLYVKNVVNYTSKNNAISKEYQEEELEIIKNFDKSKIVLKYIMPFLNKHSVELVYDDKMPILRFVPKEKFRTGGRDMKVLMLRTLVDYANKNEYFEKSGGSHICLRMGGEFEAFLRIRADKFYLIHPQRDQFLENFERSEYFVDT